MSFNSGKKKEPNPNFLVRMSSGGGGLPREGVGQKSSVCHSKPRETKHFWAGYPGIFGGMSPGCPKSLRKHIFKTEQMDAAVLGDRLPEGSQKSFLGSSSLSLQCQH